jgi:hypothetical protein
MRTRFILVFSLKAEGEGDAFCNMSGYKHLFKINELYLTVECVYVCTL